MSLYFYLMSVGGSLKATDGGTMSDRLPKMILAVVCEMDQSEGDYRQGRLFRSWCGHLGRR